MKEKHFQAMRRAKEGRWQIRSIFKPDKHGLVAFNRRAGAMAYIAMLWQNGRRDDFIADTWVTRNDYGKGATQ